MRNRSSISERSSGPAATASRQCLTAPVKAKPAVSPDTRFDKLQQVDAEVWIALLMEHRLRIAKATGVDPSRVKIQLGHC